MRTKLRQSKESGPSLINKFKDLTLYEKLSLIISFFGALSVGSIFVQFTQTRTDLKASMYATITTQTLEVNKIFLEYPELRPYFYDGKPLSEAPDKTTLDRVLILAESKLDYFDLVTTQRDYLPTDKDSEEDKSTWDKYFADSFAKSPALCKRIADNPDWYMTNLKDISRANCKNPG